VAKPKSSRAERRAIERAREKLTRQREKLAALEPGGSAHRPIEIESASLVEPRSEAQPCLRCDGEMRNVEHRAETVGTARLRIARVRCIRCDHERTFHFRLVVAAPS
jgi:hypothetical protein